MSTSLLYHAFDLRGYDYVKTEYTEGAVVFTVQQRPYTCRCPQCGSRQVIHHGHETRSFRTVPIGHKSTWIVLPIPRVECRSCGITRQVTLPFADPLRRYLKAFECYVLELGRFVTIQDVAHHLGVGWDTIKDIQKRDLQHRFKKPRLGKLKQIAIDEITIGHNHHYLTVVLNLKTGAVVFVGDGKGAEALESFWGWLRAIKAEAVATDNVASRHPGRPGEPGRRDSCVRSLPHRLAVQREAQRLPQRSVPRGHRENGQRRTQWNTLTAAEEPGEPRPREERAGAIGGSVADEPASGYGVLHEGGFAANLDAAGQGKGTPGVGRLDTESGGVLHQVLQNFAVTLGRHRRGILAYYDCRISTGPLEETNNKIKTMQRQACGFRDKEFFKLKILAIHEAKYALVG